MSYYLILEPPAGGLPIDPQQVDRVLRGTPHVVPVVAPDGTAYHYLNTFTGVHFTLDLQTRGPLDGGAASLSFDLNLVRPSFFALEAMPVVAAVAGALNLRIVDPQDARVPQVPCQSTVSALIASWTQINRWAASLLQCRQRIELAYYPREKATYYWYWAYFRSDIERQYAGQDVFIPRVLILRRKGWRRLFTAVIWLDSVDALLIPLVDFVIVERGALDRRDAGDRLSEGMIARRALLRSIDFGLTRVAGPVPHWRYSGAPGSAERHLAAIPPVLLRSAAELQVVTPDGFVDVPLRENSAGRPGLRSPLAARMN